MAKKKSKKTNETFGDWEPYVKLNPYWHVKFWFLSFAPVAIYFILGAIRSNTIAYLPIVLPLVGFVFWNIGTGLLINLYLHPGWGWLECPKCNYYKEDSIENFGTYLWNRVMPAKCPECGLDFEVENMAEWLWPYDDEPFVGKKYGDSLKIRVKPKTIQVNGRKIFGLRRFLSFGLYQFLVLAIVVVIISYFVELLLGIVIAILIYLYRVYWDDLSREIKDIGFDD